MFAGAMFAWAMFERDMFETDMFETDMFETDMAPVQGLVKLGGIARPRTQYQKGRGVDRRR
jgi:hypothetical protein